MAEYRTKSGKILTDAEIEELAEEAERGYRPLVSCPAGNESHTVKWNGGDIWCLDCDRPAVTRWVPNPGPTGARLSDLLGEEEE